MTIEELLDRIEEIKSSLENADDPHGIEGAVDELFILKPLEVTNTNLTMSENEYFN